MIPRAEARSRNLCRLVVLLPKWAMCLIGGWDSVTGQRVALA
jgi:hypothetical protein